MVSLIAATDINKEDYEFWSTFLDIYKSCEYLWSNDPKVLDDKEVYRIERQRGYLKLVKWCRTRYPNCDVNLVTKYVQQFRTNFYKQHSKVLSCRKHKLTFRPLIWYYDKLLFLVNEMPNVADVLNQPLSSDVLPEKAEKTTTKNTEECPPTKRRKSSLTDQDFLTVDDSCNSSESRDDIVTPSLDNAVKHESFDTILRQFVPSANGKPSSDNEESIPIMENRVTPLDFQNNIIAPSTDSITLTSGVTNFTSVPITSNSNQFTVDSQLDQLTPVTPYSLSSNASIPRIKLPLNSTNTQCPKPPKSKTKFSKSKQTFYNLGIKTFENILKLTEDDCSIAGQKYISDLKQMNKEQRLLTEKIINEVIYYGKSNLLSDSYVFKPKSDSIITNIKLENGN